MKSQSPVIIGSSFTGLLISRTLSLANIDHILIGGDEPDERPRLGESLHELASAEFWRWLGPEFYDYFVPKNHVGLLYGPVASILHVRDPNQPFEPIIYEGNNVPISKISGGIVNVDRSKMDRLLYQQVKNSLHCTFIYDTAAQPIYNAQDDTISAIQLSNGELIENPVYVFDATGPAAVVARAAGVEKELLGTPERLVWTHRYRADGDPVETPSQEWWTYGTTAVKLLKDIDGVGGPAWLIPIPGKISIGLSVDAAQYPPERINNEQLVQCIDEALMRRGIDHLRYYPQIRPIQTLRYQHFIRKRAYGANWLLPGIAYMQIWFTTLMGVVASTLAARLAPQLLETPEATGQLYQDTVQEHLSLHNLYQSLVKSQRLATVAGAQEFTHKIVVANALIRASGFKVVNNFENSTILSDKFEALKRNLLTTNTLSAQLSLELILALIGPTHMNFYETPLLSEQGATIGQDYFTSSHPFLTEIYTHKKRWYILDRLLAQDWEQLRNINWLELLLPTGQSAAQTKPIGPTPEVTPNLSSKTSHESLVTIQAAGPKTAFFCVTAGYDDGPLLSQMADNFGSDQPFYLLQLPTLKAQPIESLAATYIERMQSIQPNGPYQLGGFNIGGIIAFEVAKQLLASGATVSMLALIDTPYPSGNGLPALGYRQLKTMVQTYQRFAQKPQGRRITNSTQGVWRVIKSRLPEPIQDITAGETTFTRALLDEAYEINLQITQPYTPTTYPGCGITYVAATASPTRYTGTLQRWQAVTPNGLSIHLIPANMATLLESPGIQTVADILKPYLA